MCVCVGGGGGEVCCVCCVCMCVLITTLLDLMPVFFFLVQGTNIISLKLTEYFFFGSLLSFLFSFPKTARQADTSTTGK